MICSQTKKVLRVFVEINLQTAKHLTRLMGVTFKKGSYRLSKCLTKRVRSCESPPDTSHYVYSLWRYTMREGWVMPPFNLL